MRQDFKHITVASHDHIYRVSLHRPPVNALDQELVSELTSLAIRIKKDPEIWTVIVSSSLRVFCAGADLKERSGLPDSKVLSTVKNIQTMVLRWLEIPQPVIVAVNGAAVGGGLEFALSGDIIAASEEATFGFPEVKLGILPAAGGTQLITRRTSPGVAKKWILSGARFGAREALADGVVDFLYPHLQFSENFERLVDTFRSNAPLALRQAKKSINRIFLSDLQRGFDYESRCYNALVKTEDRKAGLKAFFDKQQYQWKGR